MVRAHAQSEDTLLYLYYPNYRLLYKILYIKDVLKKILYNFYIYYKSI